MQVEHPDTAPGRLDRRFCGRIRNVVKLEVKKDPGAVFDKLADDRRAFRSEKLKADLKPADAVA